MTSRNRNKGRASKDRKVVGGRARAAKAPPAAKPWARGLFLFGALLLLLGGFVLIWSFSSKKTAGGESSVFLEFSSSDPGETAEILEAAGLIDSASLMDVYLRVFVLGGELRLGPHLLSRGLSPRELAQRLYQVAGRPRRRVTLVEGWDYFQIALALQRAEVTSRVAFVAAATDPETLAELGISGSSAEGYLFPATYDFHLDSDPKKVISRLVTETRKRVALLQKSTVPHPDLENLGMGETELLILASIVEKEAVLAKERPRIARVFLNRLLRPDLGTGGRLQSDPTASYGCKVAPTSAPSCANFHGKVSAGMLRDPLNPYNSYRRQGLPPGPISNPGAASIEAVLRPAEGDELYFVANGMGGHSFSTSYDDHLRAIEELKRGKTH